MGLGGGPWHHQLRGAVWHRATSAAGLSPFVTITGVPGVRVGHWTDEQAGTGCTVVLFPAGTVASGEVRGGAPATREWALLEPHRLVARIDALVLTGGSAVGLAARAGGVPVCVGGGG